MDNPFTKPIHIDILKHLAKGRKPKELVSLTGENYENVKFHLKEMRKLAGANTSFELGVMAGAYGWVSYP
jgi:hypothetical protein